ncbi:hypothetical protein GTP58_16595 [Duganella sp. CY15W]|uniref:DUF4297 family anti-phage-associated protein n=1 Tax=Duganella sp. CY15W TaxID=2692172 RepID=UPI0013717EF5|nr:DUF4297 family anti-phage-associated protein [Duganella sp. CY15W]MYM29951.1 hypothetical protein [Duganella sp. CY15W]
MVDRAAVDTIKGYFYQFDQSILSLLNLADKNDCIDVECIEDIDVKTATETTAIQCKYYSKTKYNHSVIKEAIQYMLSNYADLKKNNKKKIKYILRGNYESGHNKLVLPITVQFLIDNFLTYTSEGVKHSHHDELNLKPADLIDFLKLLTIDINAEDFDKQFSRVIGLLKTEFNCSDFTAEHFYYNNALRVLKRLSTSSDPADRSLSREKFIKEINTSSILFNEWFVEKKGRNEYFKSLRKEYFTAMNVSSFERFFLIELDSGKYLRSDLKDLVLVLSKKWSKLSKLEPKPFCPYIFIEKIDENELLEFKNELAREGFGFIDGISYLGAKFNAQEISQPPNHSNGIKIKILNNQSDLKEAINFISKTREVYQFHLGGSFFDFKTPSVKHIKIQVENLCDIKNII